MTTPPAPTDEPVAYAVYAESKEYGRVMLREYVGSMGVIRDRVMSNARREGFTGDFVERMADLGWNTEPLYATPDRAPALIKELRGLVEKWGNPDVIDLCQFDEGAEAVADELAALADKYEQESK